VDTSALFAVLDADDKHHKKARDTWIRLVSEDETLVCSNYILIETFALVQNRLGLEAVRILQEDILPIIAIEWVDETVHRAGVSGVLTAMRKKLSLVDCVSFDIMRKLGIKKFFAFDTHFKEQGFEIA
ncbi:MAG: PIN domain-containing protein, partial [Thermodesulfovibrionia bacterium]|nr:PIN domain-containing protein [Thermodesulfovibrionia bacterium]